jgi:hypothetical protein
MQSPSGWAAEAKVSFVRATTRQPLVRHMCRSPFSEHPFSLYKRIGPSNGGRARIFFGGFDLKQSHLFTLLTSQ